jgi:hypothetical protein
MLRRTGKAQLRARRVPAGLAHGAAAFCLLGASLALFWPGVALYDSVDQYGQVLFGAYEDWHPPVMARFWSLFHPWWPGTSPMLVVQLTLYWLGIGLLAAACARRAHPAAGWTMVAIGAFLLVSGWMGAILKDAQMVGAMAAAVGIIGWFRIEERRLPLWAGAAVLLLLLYAVLLRANAVFAVAPLALGLFGWAGICTTLACSAPSRPGSRRACSSTTSAASPSAPAPARPRRAAAIPRSNGTAWSRMLVRARR